MTRQLNRLTLVFGVGFMAVALATGYWQIARASDLLQRGDNQRRALIERRVPRSVIYDRNGAVLADAAGSPGAWARHYPYPALAPVLGYVSPLVGSAGIEAALDPLLHGDAGLDPFTIYWRTSVLGVPPPGRAARLTLDLKLQTAADAALGSHIGAIVLLQAQSGQVLALASHPTFDANGIDDNWQNIVNDPSAPLLNRATLALYQPGGVIEPVVLAGALQAGLLNAGPSFANAAQLVPVDGQSIGCLAPPAQAALSITDTLAYGCPAPLAALGNSLGAAGLAKLFTQFQFFTAPGLALPTTAPTADKSGAFPDAGLAGIGQAGLTVTPLQMALVTAALVDHGQMPIPQLVLQTQNPAMGWQTTPLAPPVPVLDAVVADQVKAMLGAGQTATAVTGANGKTLAWYTGFGPFDQPQVVVAVLLEDGSPQAARDIGQALVAAAIRP